MPGGNVLLHYPGGIGTDNKEVGFSNNVLIGRETWWPIQVNIDIPEGKVRVDGNTFVQSLLNCSGGSGSPMSVARNLIYETPTWLYPGFLTSDSEEAADGRMRGLQPPHAPIISFSASDRAVRTVVGTCAISRETVFPLDPSAC